MMRPGRIPLTYALVLAAALLLPGPVTAQPSEGSPSLLLERLLERDGAEAGDPTTQLSQRCCKTCRKGKACGDSCIAREKTCGKPAGCACDVQPPQ